MRFPGRVVVITGAASGIGRATSELFAREGAVVHAADIDEAGGTALAAELGDKVHFHRCDVSQTADIKALMDTVAATSGGIDTVFNNAGAGGERAGIDEIEPDGWDRTMDLLLRSVAFGIRYAVPHMLGRTNPSFINTSSVAAVGPGYSPTAYAVAKAGVLHLTKVAATDLARHRIRVNAVQPGFINTNIFTASLGLAGDTERMAKAAIAQMSAAAQPVARGGVPNDIAETCAFLASDAASFINGQGIIVDGGLTLGPRHSWDPDTPGLFDALQAMADQQNAGTGIGTAAG